MDETRTLAAKARVLLSYDKWDKGWDKGVDGMGQGDGSSVPLKKEEHRDKL
ncbi:MAG: hypothetical protein ACOX3R_15930 [Desulfitobacteriia bacterium]|jgi:hypothetical protein